MNDEQKKMLNWRQLFPERGFAHSMALRKCNRFEFFKPRDDAESILSERKRWLAQSPELFVTLEKRAIPFWPRVVTTVAECREGVIDDYFNPPTSYDVVLNECIDWTGRNDVDWVLLGLGRHKIYQMVAGGVCFPSNWDVRDKIGQPVNTIHGPVPGLNRALAIQINRFFHELPIFGFWQRENWGLSADAELNHHPTRILKGLGANATLSTTWIRLERQFFCKLGGRDEFDMPILFCIRVYNYLLSDVVKGPGAAARIAHALETMPDDVAAYKGIAPARAGLIAQLKAVSL
ncbi:MAG TPA: heme-dependent oxidative N-demethylase subunit alpha family protein [Planctomycetota bacterium]|nr:heme-dependent oxidative N-demethylase subunit alpha family protein [Planctomycetota bacterium]